MRLGVLGPTEVCNDDGRPVELGSRKARTLLAGLVLHRGRTVSVERCIDLLWPDDPPPGAAGTLHSYVATLRRVLEPARAARSPATVLVLTGPGYVLRLGPSDVDVGRFEETVARWHSRLASRSWQLPESAEPQRAVDELTVALDSWRGEPYADLDDPDAAAERTRLAELRLVAAEDRAVAALLLGHNQPVAAELEALTTTHPLRERLWVIRALALTRAGRQAEALDVLRRFTELLDHELALDPGPVVRELQTAILRQDPDLDRHAAKPAPSVARPPQPAWPLVGRQDELGRLTTISDQVSTPTFVVVTGEPGIGKTRLTEELVRHAAIAGTAIGVGRCSQDEGMPPLWPWASVFAELGEPLPQVSGDDPGAQFRAWAAIVAALIARATAGRLLIVLEDLHWADPSSLRVLRLLAETADTGGLAVVATWRDAPSEAVEADALAAAAEALARRHATRIELVGLVPEESARLMEEVAHQVPTPAQARRLSERTSGNPFFLVEFARLAGDGRGDLAGLLAEPDPPRAVQDVLVRRLSRLPSATRRRLQFAAVVGRRFDLGLLGGAEGEVPDPLEELEPAVAAALIRESGPEQFEFTHELVREVLRSGVPASRRARWHAQIAGASGGLRPSSERARHWLAAGPTHAAAAWRAAVEAAAAARRLHAHDEAAELLRAALDRMRDDPASDPADRYAVIMELVAAYRFTGQWAELTAAVEEALDLAESSGDVERAARAGVAVSAGAFWQSSRYGQTNERVVAGLRWCLSALAPGDSAARCRVQLALGHELYYAMPLAERRDLVEAALAGARRLADDQVLLDCLLLAGAVLWSRATILDRLALAEEAIELATGLGDAPSVVIARTQQLQILGELGRVDRLPTAIARARSEAGRLQMAYAELVIDGVEQSWSSIAGEFDVAERLLGRMQLTAERLGFPQAYESVGSAFVSLRLWQDRIDDLHGAMQALRSGPLPLDLVAIMIQLRAGRLEAARTALAQTDASLPEDNWFAAVSWCSAAEIAAWLSVPSLGEQVLPLLLPLVGQCASAGSGGHQGPVDAFVALAAYAVGRRHEASRHADRAAELITAWKLPPVARWWQRQRDQFGI